MHNIEWDSPHCMYCGKELESDQIFSLVFEHEGGRQTVLCCKECPERRAYIKMMEEIK